MSRDDTLLADVTRFAREAARVTRTPGLSLALARDGHVICQAALGLADVGRRRPMRADTPVCAGSMSKTYVAITALQLVDAGLLDLNTPVSQLLPELSLGNRLGGREITTYDLLTYRSGLATDTGDCTTEPPPSLRQWIAVELARDRRPEYRGARSRWSAPVGERFQYSSVGMAIAALVVERLNPAGLSFADYVRRHVIEPLALASTDLPRSFRADDVRHGLLDRLATGYAALGPMLVPLPLLHSGPYPAITLLTTAPDHVRVLEMLSAGGELGGARLLSREAVIRMLRPHIATDPAIPGPRAHYGLGVQLKDHGNRNASFGHGGTHPYGWWSEAHAYPALGFSAVVCTNKRNVGGWYNPESETAAGLIHAFLAERLSTDAAPDRERPWGWKASYAVGIVMAERLAGTLGTHLTDDRVESMAEGAVAADRLPWSWDAAAFRAGVADVLNVEPTAAGVRRLVAGPALRIARAELDLIWLELMGRGRRTLPIPFWADR